MRGEGQLSSSAGAKLCQMSCQKIMGEVTWQDPQITNGLKRACLVSQGGG